MVEEPKSSGLLVMRNVGINQWWHSWTFSVFWQRTRVAGKNNCFCCWWRSAVPCNYTNLEYGRLFRHGPARISVAIRNSCSAQWCYFNPNCVCVYGTEDARKLWRTISSNFSADCEQISRHLMSAKRNAKKNAYHNNNNDNDNNDNNNWTLI